MTGSDEPQVATTQSNLNKSAADLRSDTTNETGSRHQLGLIKWVWWGRQRQVTYLLPAVVSVRTDDRLDCWLGVLGVTGGKRLGQGVSRGWEFSSSPGYTGALTGPALPSGHPAPAGKRPSAGLPPGAPAIPGGHSKS